MPVNVKKLRSELRFLTINPDKWDQGLWVKVEQEEKPGRPSACGSFGCLAGNTVVHEDLELAWYKEVHTVWERDEDGSVRYQNGSPVPVRHEDGRVKRVTRWQADNVIVDRHEDGEEITVPIEDRAAEELGLTSYQAEKLFSGDNDEATLWELAEKLTLGQICRSNYDDAKEERRYQAELKARIKNLENAQTYPLSS